ncbi:hypothetical protein ACFL6N_02535 [Thermodesulfobacteriota bacterium]
MNEDSLTCLINSLNEAQETIRAYDIKAEVLALVVTLALGLLSHNFGDNLDYCGWSIFVGIACIITGLISIGFVGLVLYPSKVSFKIIDTTDYSPQRSYYINTDNFTGKIKISSFLEQIEKTNWKAELAYEILKCSSIRDRKHFWFVNALRVSALTLFLSGVFWLRMMVYV